MVSDILVATDLSEHAATALKRAVELVRIQKARLHIFHAIDDRYHHDLLETIGSMAEHQLKSLMRDILTKEQIKRSKLYIVT